MSEHGVYLRERYMEYAPGKVPQAQRSFLLGFYKHLLGAVFGLCAYGTYDLTNLATLKGWPPGIAMLDLAWGAVLTGLSATAGYVVTKALL